MCKFGKEVMGCRKKLRQNRYKKYLFFILDQLNLIKQRLYDLLNFLGELCIALNTSIYVFLSCR